MLDEVMNYLYRTNIKEQITTKQAEMGLAEYYNARQLLIAILHNVTPTVENNVTQFSIYYW